MKKILSTKDQNFRGRVQEPTLRWQQKMINVVAEFISAYWPKV
jgi:hypothetical protein